MVSSVLKQKETLQTLIRDPELWSCPGKGVITNKAFSIPKELLVYRQEITS